MKRFAIAAIGCFAAAGLLGLAGARVNATPSFPLGLYWISRRPPVKGELALFCPPKEKVFMEARERGYLPAGFCEAGTRPMIKKIVAAAGDQVTIEPGHTTINGEVLANSAQFQADPAGRPLPAYQARLTLAEGQVLLMSDYNPRSFDARYFGPVGTQQVRGVLAPVLTLPTGRR